MDQSLKKPCANEECRQQDHGHSYSLFNGIDSRMIGNNYTAHRVGVEDFTT